MREGNTARQRWGRKRWGVPRFHSVTCVCYASWVYTRANAPPAAKVPRGRHTMQNVLRALVTPSAVVFDASAARASSSSNIVVTLQSSVLTCFPFKQRDSVPRQETGRFQNAFSSPSKQRGNITRSSCTYKRLVRPPTGGGSRRAGRAARYP